MNTPKDEIQNSISECENKERFVDNQQSGYLYKLSEMLNWAMKDNNCGKILEEAHQDMMIKSERVGEDFLQSLKILR